MTPRSYSFAKQGITRGEWLAVTLVLILFAVASAV